MARKIPKFPLKMANDADVRNIEELCKNADIESMVNYFLDGTILKWCKAYGYNDLVGELLELNDTLISKLYKIFGMEINPEELEDFLQKYDELFNNYSNFVEYKIKQYNTDEKFTESCIAYIESKIDIRCYEITLSSVEEDNETVKYFELEVCNQFTDVYLKCIVPYQDIENLDNTAKNNLFFDKVYAIIKSIDDVSSCCGEIDFFGSGGYGYGLELI